MAGSLTISLGLGLLLAGSLKAAAQSGPPTFASVALSGPNLVVTGSGGDPGSTYIIWGTTNVLLTPLSLWTKISTNTFAPDGNFTNSIPFQAEITQEFFLVEELPAPGPAAVAAYSFDEGMGTTASDVTGNGHNGSINGATWTTSGKYGGALVFDGSGALVSISDAASLHLTTGVTLEAWVNPSAVDANWCDVVYKGNDNYFLEGCSYPGGLPVAGATCGSADVVTYGTANLIPNTWTHLAMTYDGTTVRLFVNGVETSTAPQSGNMVTSSNPLQIGGDSIFGQYFQGAIDEVRVYNLALSAAQIQADMNTPLGNTPTAPGNLTATTINSNQVNLSWLPATGKLGVTGYLVERQGPGSTGSFVQIGTTNLTTYIDTGLAPGTNYSYRVRATDSQGDLGPYSSVALAFTGFSINPRVSVLTPNQTQQFQTNFGNVNVTWSVDGLVGGSAAAGTITTGGLYTPPGSAGTHTVTATTTNPVQVANSTVYVTANPGMFMFHNDTLRSGQNLSETVLSPANVNSNSFGKLSSYTLDGMTFASPLYVAGVSIPGKGVRNVVYVATEHDSLYAFDADALTNGPLWQLSFINPAAGITTVPAADTGETGDIPNEIGITGTPAIDPVTSTLYVVAKTKEGSGSSANYVLRLHALNLSTGSEKFGAPVILQASALGGQVPFDPLRENQRTALLLLNGMVCFGFASHGDILPYYGWLLGYNATNVQQQVLVYNTAPNGTKAGIWMNGNGPAVDASSNLFFITGDGLFDASSGGTDYGDCFVKVNPAGNVLDYFAPRIQSTLDASNLDLAAGGVLLLPDQSGPHTHEMVSAGKNGAIYLVDRDNMGHYNSSSDQIVQSIVNAFTGTSGQPSGNFGSPVCFNGSVYFSAVNDYVRAFQLGNGLLSTSPTSLSSTTFGFPGGMLAISANGNANGILWAVERKGAAASGTLHAYDAANLANQLYNSDQAAPRDTLDVAAKYTIPLVINGKVFVVSVSQLTVYGLLP